MFHVTKMFLIWQKPRGNKHHVFLEYKKHHWKKSINKNFTNGNPLTKVFNKNTIKISYSCPKK